MTVIELKEKLIAEIRNTDNVELLDHLSDVIEFESNVGDIHVMSPGEIEAVNDGLEQFKKGQWVSHEEANREIDEWLKK